MNGQVWDQVHYAYRYHYAFMPRAIVVREGGRHFLEVSGLNELEVRRVT